MTKFFALTSRGLEAVSADEIGALAGVAVDEIGYRRVAGVCSAPLTSLLALRTVDDVFLNVTTWHGIERPRSTLARLKTLSAQLNLHLALTLCSDVRSIQIPPRFSITVNFVGKRNYSAEEIKEACADGIGASHPGWTYTHDDGIADLNVRIFIEHQTAHVGTRVAKTPLYRRAYKQRHVPGSLKPSVAAALLSLAEVSPRMRVLDPCCGAGTILIEAAMRGALAEGGDIDDAAIAAAKFNALAAHIPVKLHTWDAQALPIVDFSIDRIVCNLPWGREVGVSAGLRSLYEHICAEMRRVLVPGGQLALLTNAPQLLDLSGFRTSKQIEISLFGQTPTILIARSQV